MDPADLTALAAALEIPFRARREQHRYLRHGRARQRAPEQQRGLNRRLDLHRPPARHPDAPAPEPAPKVIGALLGADGTTISHATSLTASLLARPPAATRRPAARHPPAHPPATCANTPCGHGITIPGDTSAHIPQIAHYKPRHPVNSIKFGMPEPDQRHIDPVSRAEGRGESEMAGTAVQGGGARGRPFGKQQSLPQSPARRTRRAGDGCR